MGVLIDGQWRPEEDSAGKEGEFVRQTSRFRNWVTPDGAAGPSGRAGFGAAAERYQLFVSLACPWAHRTLIFRRLKDLQRLIGLTVVEPLMLENGWQLGPDAQRSCPVKNISYLYQLYQLADDNYSGRVSVPVLWDKEQQTIVNNESAEIIRMFNSAFNSLSDNQSDYYPEEQRQKIDEVNERVYHSVNNGVYKAGFAKTQQAYEQAFDQLFTALDWLDERLSGQRYLVGSQLTEADWRLFTTLVRFDAVYFGHFKANLRRIEDYPHLSHYLRDLYQHPGIAETVDLKQIKTHYYGSHRAINPTRIIPKGPKLDYTRAHNRQRFPSTS